MPSGGIVGASTFCVCFCLHIDLLACAKDVLLKVGSWQLCCELPAVPVSMPAIFGSRGVSCFWIDSVFFSAWPASRPKLDLS